MIADELNVILDEHRYIEWKECEDGYLFRNITLPWYYNNPENCTKITLEKLWKMNIPDFFNAINYGLQVVGITRITGYFTKITNWNAGKRAELRDRYRSEII